MRKTYFPVQEWLSVADKQRNSTGAGTMKVNIPIIFCAGILLVSLAIQTGCSRSTGNLVFERDRQFHVIDTESGAVSIFDPEGTMTEIIGVPSAGVTLIDEFPSPSAEVRGLIQSIMYLLLFEKGSISGIVWDDVNGNRVIDPGEKGVENVLVFLDADNTGTFTPDDKSGMTGPDGLYIIGRVRAGTNKLYLDSSTLPAGFAATTTQPHTVITTDDQVITDADHGIQNQSGFITGTVWDDTDDAPIPEILVYLDMNLDYEYTIGEPHAWTDGSGSYLISSLPGGTYKFNIDDETVPAKYYQPPGAGTNHTDVTLPPGGSQVIDRSYSHKATISGVVLDAEGNAWGYIRVFIDLNGNGVYDAGEPVAVTDQFGNFIFTDLAPGTYTVIIPVPGGHDLLVYPDPVVLFAGSNYTGAHFLTQARPASITGIAWSDENGNGLRNEDETGLAGVPVFLDTNNNGQLDTGEPSTLTDGTGTYGFTGLAQGTYTIRADDSDLLDAHKPTTVNPLVKSLSAGEAHDGARFGYQRKMAVLHTLLYPARLSWGSDGRVYVSDNTNGSVFIFDSSLNLQGELKKLSKPLAVGTDASGNIYVGNSGRGNVEIYDPSGNLVGTIGNGSIATPNDIDFDRDGNIYIVDSDNDAVIVYDSAGNPTGTVIGDSSTFDYASSIAISYRDDGTGTEIAELYVADQPNCIIHVFELNGSRKGSVGACGSLYTTNWDGKFAGLVAVDTDQFGNIHGLDNSLNVVQVFNPQTGSFIRSYNAYPVENESLLNLQTDISIHQSDNRVIMSNVSTRSVETIETVPAP